MLQSLVNELFLLLFERLLEFQTFLRAQKLFLDSLAFLQYLQVQLQVYLQIFQTIYYLAHSVMNVNLDHLLLSLENLLLPLNNHLSLMRLQQRLTLHVLRRKHFLHSLKSQLLLFQVHWLHLLTILRKNQSVLLLYLMSSEFLMLVCRDTTHITLTLIPLTL